MSLTQLELFDLHRQFKIVEKQLIDKTFEMYQHPEEEGKEERRAEMLDLTAQRDALKEQYIEGGGDPGQLEVDVA
jgi:hypothetical protein